MCTLITSKGTDLDENIANQNHATRTRTPKPWYLNLSNSSYSTRVRRITVNYSNTDLGVDLAQNGEKQRLKMAKNEGAV